MSRSNDDTLGMGEMETLPTNLQIKVRVLFLEVQELLLELSKEAVKPN